MALAILTEQEAAGISKRIEKCWINTARSSWLTTLCKEKYWKQWDTRWPSVHLVFWKPMLPPVSLEQNPTTGINEFDHGKSQDTKLLQRLYHISFLGLIKRLGVQQPLQR